MAATPAQRVEMIPVDRITVVNPRIRNKRGFKSIVDNIAELGLKRPITVTRRAEAGGPYYDLVCGQGRLEAFRMLGQSEVPALVVNADKDDCLVASLVENCARRQHRAIDLLQDIEGMKRRGYSAPEIARKTGLSSEYIYAVIKLIEKGEERLLRSVETGAIPFSVALEIAEADDAGVQAALQNAYENNLLRGKKLKAAKRLVEIRGRRGRSLKYDPNVRRKPMSSTELVEVYQQEAERKRLLIRRAEATQGRIAVVVEGLRRLLGDEPFRRLLAEQGLETMPAPVAERLRRTDGGAS